MTVYLAILISITAATIICSLLITLAALAIKYPWLELLYWCIIGFSICTVTFYTLLTH